MAAGPEKRAVCKPLSQQDVVRMHVLVYSAWCGAAVGVRVGAALAASQRSPAAFGLGVHAPCSSAQEPALRHHTARQYYHIYIYISYSTM